MRTELQRCLALVDELQMASVVTEEALEAAKNLAEKLDRKAREPHSVLGPKTRAKVAELVEEIAIIQDTAIVALDVEEAEPVVCTREPQELKPPAVSMRGHGRLCAVGRCRCSYSYTTIVVTNGQRN
jgi:hypothetical protein